MITLIGLLAAQAAVNPTDWDRGIQPFPVSAQEVIVQATDCVDSQVKLHLRQQISNATPQSIVSMSLESCDFSKISYANAITYSANPITKNEANHLADKLFCTLQNTYIKHLEEIFIQPEFAQARSKLAIAQFRKCVTDKAEIWSRLQDDASTIAQAALTACHNDRRNVVTSVGFELLSESLPASNAESVTEEVQKAIKDVAISTIITERAKRLPKKQ